ncbi:MAG: hypothetical protein ABR570_09245, partial [Burkholderiales bacterium]
YSYGLARNWEVSLQLPLAFDSRRAAKEGDRVELQYIAPHDEERGLYLGINLELARDARIAEQHFWTVEIIPIVGWRTGRWHFAANPGIERPLDGSHSAATPAAKIAYGPARSAVGLEYYSDPQGRTLYLAWDGKAGKSDLNLGIGRGLSGEADRWVLKAIYEIAF